MSTLLPLDDIDRRLEDYRTGQLTPSFTPPSFVTARWDPIAPHQIGVIHLVYKPRFLLVDPPGTGKTPQALVAFALLRQANPTIRALIVTRATALFQWQDAVYKFLQNVSCEVVGYQGTSELDPLQRRDQYERWYSGQTAILIVSYHTIARDWTGERSSRTAAMGPATAREWLIDPRHLGEFALILDEIQTCKSRVGRLITPAIRLISYRARYCWGLTATPIMNRLEDLYGVVETVRPGTLGNYYLDFAPRYLRRVKIPFRRRQGSSRRHFWKVIGYQNMPHLMARIRPYYLQRSLADFGHAIPDVVVESRMVTLSPEQRAVYHTVRQRYIPPIQHTDTTTAARLSAAPRPATPETPPLHALASLLYVQLAADAPRVLGVEAPSAKLTELVTLLTNDLPEEKVVVYTRFEQVATLILSALKRADIAAVRITGRENPATRRKAQIQFQTDPSIRVVCVTSAGGEAIDLQAARVVIFFDLPWSWGEFTQVVGRVRRRNSPHTSLLVILLGALNTIDTHTLTILQRKEALINATFKLPTLLNTVSFDDPRTTILTASTVPATPALTIDPSFTHELWTRLAGESDEAPPLSLLTNQKGESDSE